MNSKYLLGKLDRRACCIISGGVLLAATTQAALAQDPSDSLNERVQELEEQFKNLKAEKSVTEDNIAGQLRSGRLGFESADGKFEFQVNGRILLDTRWADADGRELGQETDFRAVRLGVAGTLYHDWMYKLDYDFTGSGESGIKDAYLKYMGFQPAGNQLELSLGNRFQPFGLESQQSSKYTTMMELSAPTATLGAGPRRLGIRTDLYSDVWHFRAGVAQRVPGSEDSPRGGDDPVDVAAQFFVDPVNRPGDLVHIGTSVRRHWNQGLDNQFDGRSQ